MDKDLTNFLKILDTWKFGYQRVLCKYFVSKKDGKNHLLYGMIGFTNEEIAENIKNGIYVETEQCIAGQEIFELSPEYYDQVLKTLKEAPHLFRTSKQEFQLPVAENQKCSMHFDPLSFPLINSTMRNPFLRVSGNTNHQILPDVRTLGLELRNLDTPYEDVQDLFFALGFSMEIFESNRIPHIEYIATMPMKHMTANIEDRRKLHMKFSFPSAVKKQKFKVGVRLFRKDRSDPRFIINGNDFKWSKEGAIHTATLTKEIEDLEIAKLFPSYADENIGTYIAVDPKLVTNNRPEIDKVFYDGRKIDDFLNSKDSDEFEFGVSSLLHYYKLSVQRYSGVRTLTDGPDLVAFSNLNHIYVIECTTGTPNHKGKLHKLHTRTEKLKKHYQEKGLNQDLIRPVIFTNLPKENTLEDRADLANYGISLVTKDDFEGMISRLHNPPSDAELFEAAMTAIPSKEPENQLSLLKSKD
jgi:uncharacterized protein (DUF1778 family)